MNDLIQISLDELAAIKIPEPKPIEVGKTYELYTEHYSYHIANGGTLEDFNIGLDYHLTLGEFLGMLSVDHPLENPKPGRPQYCRVKQLLQTDNILPNSFKVLEKVHYHFEECWDEDHPETAVEVFQEDNFIVRLHY